MLSYNSLRYLHSFFRPHAEDESYPVEVSDKPFIKDHDQGEADHNDNQELDQDAHIPTYNVPADTKDNCLVEQVKREHRLVAVGQCFGARIQVSGANAQNKDNGAPTRNGICKLIDNIRQ